MSEVQVLHQVLSCYGLAGARAILLQSSGNHVYRIEAENGNWYSLRICPLTFRDRRWLEDELTWLDFVVNRGRVRVPRPIRTGQDELLTVVPTVQGNRIACLFEWVEGVEAATCLTTPVLRAMGRAVAGLHQTAREFGFPAPDNDFRRDYCYDRTLAASHRDWIAVHQAEIGAANTQLLMRAVDWVVAEMDEFSATPQTYGFIHADLHLGNFLVADGQVSVIDFDQLGRGHYLYDLAVVMVELLDDPAAFPWRWESFKAGYSEIMDLPFGTDGELDLFVVAVNLGFLDWVYNATNPAVRRTKMAWVPATYASIRRRLPHAQP